ncbi:MAG: lactate dehydrogenase [Rhodospirillaceae bacterium]|nr:lactate dehydrogenase [Rhodospirillaceae bacterium]|tara:strand:+ start:25 stop:1050 length:1026 start_codon:yes stop_codon:yes gene_type:complete
MMTNISPKINISLEEAKTLAYDIFSANDCSEEMADVLSEVVMLCERDGPASHGFFSMYSYVNSLRNGISNGKAMPTLEYASPSVLRVDGDNGYNQLPISKFKKELISAAQKSGIATLAIRNSHHIGPLRHDLEPLAEAGLVAFSCVVSKALMTSYSGTKKVFGTDPIAFACPRTGKDPIVWDMSTSAMSFMEIEVASTRSEKIPPDSAVDKHGAPTVNSIEAINGGMLLPFAKHKGSAIAFMVELMAAGLTGGRFAFENSDADKPDFAGANRGQTIIAMAPEVIHGTGFLDRVEIFLTAYRDSTAERIPGDGRLTRRKNAVKSGIFLDPDLLKTVKNFLNK